MFDSVQGLKTKRQKKADKKAARQTGITTCFVSAWCAAAHLARLLDFSPSIISCARNPRSDHCAAAIVDIFGQLGWISAAISNAINVCPKERNNQAFCSTAISRLVSGLADLSSAATVVTGACYRKGAPLGER